MVSIEAYRASVGRFYSKAKCLSNTDNFNTNMSCFFNAYLNYLVLHFNKIFGLLLLEFYDSSFLKRFKLLIDGDIESNPGPTQANNIYKTPVKGRPKKTGFKSTPKKLKLDTVSLDNIKPWSVTCPSTMNIFSTFNVNTDINTKVSLYQGDITKLEVDAIVNAANKTLLGGGGIDKAIHKAAGPELKNEYKKFPEKHPGVRCESGECKVTKVIQSHGCTLPANYVFHTVGPKNQNSKELKDCYESCLQNVLTYPIKSIAFCCIATGIYGFDQRKAAEIALNTVRVWLEYNHLSVNRIIFCTYENEDFGIYKDLMSTVYFPVSNNHLSENINETLDLVEINDEYYNELYEQYIHDEINDELDDLSKSPMMNNPNRETPIKDIIKNGDNNETSGSCSKSALAENVYFTETNSSIDFSTVTSFESNTGPTQNSIDKTPQSGRRKKNRGFKGTPKKQKKENIDFTINCTIPDPCAPLGLLNCGENVCFFNSVMQVLYNLPMFQNFIQQLPAASISEVSVIKRLFEEISYSNVPVRTSTCVQDLQLRDYRVGMQYDAHECLIQLFEKIYPNIGDDCIFKVSTLESTVCENCGHSIDKSETCNHLSLNLEDTNSLQTISEILSMVMHPHGRPLLDYRCDNCHSLGSCTKGYYVTYI